MKSRAALSILLLLLLCGCAPPAPAAPSAPSPSPTPVLEEDPVVRIGSLILDESSRSAALDCAAEDGETFVRALADNRDRLSSLEEIDLGDYIPDYASYVTLKECFPRAEIRLALSFLDQPLTEDTTALDLHTMTPDQTDELLRVLPYLRQLEEIGFVAEDGSCAFAVEDIPQLDRIREAVPSVRLKVAFDLFGQRVTSEDERIEYYLTHIGNDGADTVRAVLPYLTSCTYLLMDGCDVDNEVMASLREDFPTPKIVWRVWLIEPWYSSRVMMRRASFLTDTERIRTTMVSPDNCDVLKYCTETKYVDFGHNFRMSDYYFLAYMPKLEACIIAISHVSDLTPLASCPELEYLEVFTTDITTVAPLANCKKLEYLNIANCKKLTDITGLYDLTSLKVLRMVVTPNVPQEQKDELARRLPECTILKWGGDPTENGWRDTPRYYLLREQMRYDEDRNLYGIP